MVWQLASVFRTQPFEPVSFATRPHVGASPEFIEIRISISLCLQELSRQAFLSALLEPRCTETMHHPEPHAQNPRGRGRMVHAGGCNYRRQKAKHAQFTRREGLCQPDHWVAAYLFLPRPATMLTLERDRDELDHLLTHKRVGVYCGVDPTAPSLHVGHMVPFMVLGWMYIYGYHSTFLVGQILLFLPWYC